MTEDLSERMEEQTINSALGTFEQFVENMQDELLPFERQDAARRLDALIKKIFP